MMKKPVKKIERICEPELQFVNKDKQQLTVDEWFKDLKRFDLKSVLTEKAQKRLFRLKNREYLMDKNESRIALLGILDVSLAYLHEYRSNDFELTCESGWVINKLSATLSCFVEFENVEQLLVSFMRRALLVPLFKSFNFAKKVIEDLKDLLKLGKRFLLKLLLEIASVFATNAPRYLLNTIYIEDMCVFIQKMDDKNIQDLLNELGEVVVKFEDLHFPEEEQTGICEEETKLNKIEELD